MGIFLSFIFALVFILYNNMEAVRIYNGGAAMASLEFVAFENFVSESENFIGVLSKEQHGCRTKSLYICTRNIQNVHPHAVIM